MAHRRTWNTRMDVPPEKTRLSLGIPKGAHRGPQASLGILLGIPIGILLGILIPRSIPGYSDVGIPAVGIPTGMPKDSCKDS